MDEKQDGRYQRLRRRHVYLHRLAGDDVFATKIESQPKAPFIMDSWLHLFQMQEHMESMYC